jgi:glycosyltransferase involved in cell wall biosynthesis
MIILIVSQERRYERIVNEIRKSEEVDYIFMGNKLLFDNGDCHLPRLFGFNRGFRLLAYLFTAFKLLGKKYDVCLTDYKCIYMTTFFPVISKLAGFFETCFIYDLRTIPVDYPEEDAKKVEKSFSRKLRFADRFYQGVTVITEEMKSYLSRRYQPFTVPVGIWETGVDVARFRPAEVNLRLRAEMGFDNDDFVCFYHGTITGWRGIIELVQSFSLLKSRDHRIKLFLLGRGSSCDKIRQIISKHGLENTVRLHDWVEYSRVPEYIAMADLCVVPLPDIDWWRVSSPFKLMEYIACGKNILLTDMVAHTNVVGVAEEYFWLDDATPESFAKGILGAYASFREDPVAFTVKGRAAREKYVDPLSWEQRALAFREFLTRVTDSRRRNPTTLEDP